MTDCPLVSIALCVHDGARYLPEQLQSVLAQVRVRLEVVAVDDDSHDRSWELLCRYAARDRRIRCFRNARNLGPSASFERAMSLTRGGLIAPCDQDDIWECDKLLRLAAALGENDLAYCDSAYTDAQGRPTGRRLSDDTPMLSGCDPLPFLFANSVSGHAALVRRELFEAARPFPAGVFFDWWLALCAADRCGVVFVDCPLVRYRRYSGAFTELGRDHPRTRAPTYNAIKLARLRARVAGFAARGSHARRESASLCAALDEAIATRNAWPLAAEVWKLRAAAPPVGCRNAWANGISLITRLRRRLRRARRERPPLPSEMRT